VRVSPADGATSVLGAKTFNVSPKGPVDFALPVNPAGWTLEFSDSGVPFSSNLNARVEGGKTSPVPAFLDLAGHRLFATQPQLEAIVTIQPAQLASLFDTDLAELKPAAAKALDEAVNGWKQNPSTKVVVSVHAKKGTGKGGARKAGQKSLSASGTATSPPSSQGTTGGAIGSMNAGYAANQASDSIVSFRVDETLGGLTPTGEVISTGSPSSIVFVNSTQA